MGFKAREPITMTGKAFLLAALATAVLTGCERAPRGKDYLNSHLEELSELTKACADGSHPNKQERSEEHTDELQALISISYDVLRVKKITLFPRINNQMTTYQQYYN